MSVKRVLPAFFFAIFIFTLFWIFEAQNRPYPSYNLNREIPTAEIAESLGQTRNRTRLIHFPIGDAFAFVDNNNRGGREHFWNLVDTAKWEPSTFLIFNTVITHLTTVIDFGAWIGPTTLYAAHFAKQVFALEPDIVAYQELHRNINLNAERLRNVHPYHRCISTKREVVIMNAGPLGHGDSMSTVNRSAGANRVLPVQCDTIAHFVREFKIQMPVFIKVDTEGFEAEIIPSWTDFIAEFKPTVYLSMHQYIRKYSDSERAKVLSTLALFPYALVATGEHTFASVSLNSSSTQLCIACDYLLSFEKYF